MGLELALALVLAAAAAAGLPAEMVVGTGSLAVAAALHVEARLRLAADVEQGSSPPDLDDLVSSDEGFHHPFCCHIDNHGLGTGISIQDSLSSTLLVPLLVMEDECMTE